MISGDQFLELAGRLAATAGGEAECRTAVSRAYYGAFHLALTLIQDLGFSIPANANAHAIVQRYLIGAGHTDAQRAGSLLSSLHADRIRADYRLQDSRLADVQFTRLRVALAQEIRSALAACRRDSVREAVIRGIREYRRLVEGRE
jgi:hypothetical protein